MSPRPSILIVTGYGLNCEAESRYAWDLAGAAPQLMHLNDLLDQPARLNAFSGLMFIGGFSFGDHLGSGLVLANRLRARLRDDIQHFIEAGRIVLGVCNGFQIMTKLGLLPGSGGEYFAQKAALMQNDCGTFQNYWVTLRCEPASPCIFTRGMDVLPLPIRHGEGKLVTASPAVLARIEREHGVACRYADPATGQPTQSYPHNPNGSVHAAAGLCDPTGRVFGLMPHPEAYLFPENHPRWAEQKIDGTLPEQGLGLRLFENAVRFLRES